jgi:6-dehydroglucose reductase
MRQVEIGPSGRRVGALGFGCWRFLGHELSQAETLVETALGLGMTLIDTADIYGFGGAGFGAAETLLGKVLKADPARRGRMVLATKGGIIPPAPYNSSRKYLIQACEASLSRLGVEQIDLYQIHRPDLLTPWEEVARALETLVADGKIAMAGVSNFSLAQARALQAHLGPKLVSTQPEFSALQLAPLEDGTLDWCQEVGAAPLAWSPLAGGRLGDEYAPQFEESVALADVHKVLDGIAAAHDARRSDVALAFVLMHPAQPIVLLGTQTPARLKAATRALDIELSRQEWYSIIEASRGAPMP